MLLALWGCSTATISSGGTLLSGLAQYSGDMQSSNSYSQWTARQGSANRLKLVITGTVGVSPEFFRLIDLDLRKREFTITLRETNVSPQRMKEMQDQLEQMDEEIAALKPVVKTQLSAQLLHEQSDGIDAIATAGMLGIALDELSPSVSRRGVKPPSTKVGEYLVTDFGSFASVRAPNGDMFRCHVFGSLDEGAGVTCEPGS